MKEYKRNCPKCGKEIIYKHQSSFCTANKKNSLCIPCKNEYMNKNRVTKENANFVRNCPSCNKEIYYKTERGYKEAETKNKKCIGCNSKETMSDKFKSCCFESDKSSGKNNSMYGKTFYEVWLEKYGKDIADNKMKDLKRKRSEQSKGEGNPMYGKPAPKKSGNGWNGHYLGYHFRSLLELSYLKYLLDNDIQFESGESKQYMIKYESDGIQRNYFPDFYLLDSGQVIELKPKKLVNTKVNTEKFQAAKNKYNDKFIILTENDIPLIEISELHNLYIQKAVVFSSISENKFKKYLKEVKFNGCI